MKSPKIPKRDPAAAHGRKRRAARRVGLNAQCACGEKRPEALIAGSNPIICAVCKRRKEDKTTVDSHHVAGKANSPITIPVPVNDHRAELSVAQQDWPKQTRENPNRSPLLAVAAGIRGFVDYMIYLAKKFLLWGAEMLEALDQYLAERLGPKWWLGTPLESFAP
ncbi:MAG: hypothetical protein IH899_16850 [Planctomycetes bacterium]|nr:hypothetical protein [Planctomycetota bacterium]